MAEWSKKLVSMELDDEDKFDAPQPIAMSNKPDFPYGLRICLGDKELTKLGLDGGDCEFGDSIALHALGEVTNVSRNDNGNGAKYRIEIQIQAMRAIEPGKDD